MAWSVKMLMVLMLAFNYTETNALPDCLRLLDASHHPWPNLDMGVRGRQEHLTGLMHGNKNDSQLRVRSRIAVGVVFVSWVVAFHMILS